VLWAAQIIAAEMLQYCCNIIAMICVVWEQTVEISISFLVPCQQCENRLLIAQYGSTWTSQLCLAISRSLQLHCSDVTTPLYNSVDLKLIRILLKIRDIIFFPDNYDYKNSTREYLLHFLHLREKICTYIFILF